MDQYVHKQHEKEELNVKFINFLHMHFTMFKSCHKWKATLVILYTKSGVNMFIIEGDM